MENILLANLLRGTASTILNIMLMFSLGEFKYGKRFTTIVFSVTTVLIVVTISYFYIFQDLTTLARFEMVIWFVAILCLKLLFKDSMMKWLFNAVTVFNIGIFVIVVSYALSRMLPYPMYANTVIRIIIYLVFIISFRKTVYPLYRQVVDRWPAFLMVTLGIMVNYTYILLRPDDITQAIIQNLTLLLLLSVLMFLIYGTIFWSFGKIVREYEFCRSKEQVLLHENLLYSQLAAHEEFVEVSKHHRHDLRHHNQIVMEYLKSGDLEGAEQYLYLYDKSLTEATMQNYCQHHMANVLLGRYAQKAQEEGITFTAKTDIPENIIIPQLEFGSLLSNILENALEDCRNIETDNPFVIFTTTIEEENLKIEIKNSVKGKVEIRNNLPVSTNKGSGIGKKSMVRIVEKHHGTICFRQENDILIIKIILPIGKIKQKRGD